MIGIGFTPSLTVHYRIIGIFAINVVTETQCMAGATGAGISIAKSVGAIG